MTESFKLQDYTFILTRKNDTALTISATPELNKSMFESGLVELKKVKCDTVSAALGNSNSKNLAIKIHHQEGNQPYTGQLLLSIVVKYEFLPEFSEEIVLKERKLDEGDALKVRLANLENEMETINKTMSIIKNEGVIKLKDQKISNLRDSNNVEISLTKGKYLLQISGLHKSTSYATIGFKVTIEPKGKKEYVKNLAKINPFFINATYSFPFSLSEVIELEDDSILKVCNKETNTYNSTANNFIVSAKPVVV